MSDDESDCTMEEDQKTQPPSTPPPQVEAPKPDPKTTPHPALMRMRLKLQTTPPAAEYRASAHSPPSHAPEKIGITAIPSDSIRLQYMRQGMEKWNAANPTENYTIKEWAWFKHSERTAFLILPVPGRFAGETDLGIIKSGKRGGRFIFNETEFDFRILRHQMKIIEETRLYGKGGVETIFDMRTEF